MYICLQGILNMHFLNQISHLTIKSLDLFTSAKKNNESILCTVWEKFYHIGLIQGNKAIPYISNYSVEVNCMNVSKEEFSLTEILM